MSTNSAADPFAFAVAFAAVSIYCMTGHRDEVLSEPPSQLESVGQGWKPFDLISDSRWVDLYGVYVSSGDDALREDVPRLLELNGQLLTYPSKPEVRLQEARSLLSGPVDDSRWRDAADLWAPSGLDARHETMLKFASGFLEDPDFSGFREFRFEASLWLGSAIDGDRARVSLVGREVALKNPSRVAPTDGWVTQGVEQWDVELVRVDGTWRLLSIAHYPMNPGSGR